MPGPQFTLRALVAVLVVGAFFGGMVAGQLRERRLWEEDHLADWQKHVLDAQHQVRRDLSRLRESRNARTEN